MHKKLLVKLALVSIPFGENDDGAVPPLGLMSIASYLNSKIITNLEVEIFDFSGENINNFACMLQLKNWGANAIGFTVFSSHVLNVIQWAKYVKNLLPSCIIFCGGPHISLSPINFISAWGSVFNFCVFGEGEIPTYNFIKLLQKNHNIDDQTLASIPNIAFLSCKTGEIIKTSKAPKLSAEEWCNPLLTSIIKPKHQELIFTDLIDNKDREAIALTSSRGCPMICSFCSIITTNHGEPKWYACSADTLIKWLKEAYAIKPFKHIYFMDANFFVKPQRVKDFAQQLADNFDDITWSAPGTINYIIKLEYDLPILFKNGLRMVELGIESGSQKQLNFLNKTATVKGNHEAVFLLQKNNITVGLDFIMFYSDQTRNEIKENLLFLLQARLTQIETFEYYRNILTFYPGTPNRENKENELNCKFDWDILPNSKTLFKDKNVERIYFLFIFDFANKYFSIIEEIIFKMKQYMRTIDIVTNRGLISKIRLTIIYLRHIPFKILWDLTNAKNLDSIYSAVPNLSKYEKLLKRLMHTY